MSEPGVPLRDVVEYLDDFLRIRDVADEPNAVNGLQVENAGTIDRIVAAVDASLEAIEGAGERDSGSASQETGTLLLVHHGLFWEGNAPLTGRRFRRVRALIDRNLALYSAHRPEDVSALVEALGEALRP